MPSTKLLTSILVCLLSSIPVIASTGNEKISLIHDQSEALFYEVESILRENYSVSLSNDIEDPLNTLYRKLLSEICIFNTPFPGQSLIPGDAPAIAYNFSVLIKSKQEDVIKNALFFVEQHSPLRVISLIFIDYAAKMSEFFDVLVFSLRLRKFADLYSAHYTIALEDLIQSRGNIVLNNFRYYLPLFEQLRSPSAFDQWQEAQLVDLPYIIAISYVHPDDRIDTIFKRLTGWREQWIETGDEFWHYAHRFIGEELAARFAAVEKLPRRKGPVKSRIKVGEELTFVPRDEKKNLLNFLVAWKAQIHKRAHEDALFQAEITDKIDDDERLNIKVTSPYSMEYSVFIDDGVIEITFNPYIFRNSVKRAHKPVDNFIQELFETANTLGLTAHKWKGGGHKHLDIEQVFDGNFGLFLRFFIDVHQSPFIGLALGRQEKENYHFQYLKDLDFSNARITNLNRIARYVKKVDSSSSREFLEDTISYLRKYVYFGLSDQIKNMAINLEHITPKFGQASNAKPYNTIELRYLPPWPNKDLMYSFNEVIVARLQYLQSLQSKGGLWPRQKYLSYGEISPKKAQQKFRLFLEASATKHQKGEISFSRAKYSSIALSRGEFSPAE